VEKGLDSTLQSVSRATETVGHIYNLVSVQFGVLAFCLTRCKMYFLIYAVENLCLRHVVTISF